MRNMNSTLLQLKDIFRKSLSKSFPNLSEEQISSYLEIIESSQPQFGHYQFNSAMKLAKSVSMSPRNIAETIVKNIDSHLIQKLEIAGPGFVNITLKTEYLASCVYKMMTEKNVGISQPTKPQKIIVEFSSPNTAKELHVGHLRSTIIGDSLAHLFETLGHDVLRLNHIGDWGTPFGMLIAYMQQYHEDVLLDKRPAELNELVSWYKAAKENFDTDEEFKKKAYKALVELQSGNPEAFKVWEKICSISRASYEQIYELLQIKINERGESFYRNELPEVVADLESKGLVQKVDGAKCVFPEGYLNREGLPLPLIVQKSDDGYTYATTDITAMRHRAQTEKADRIIVVTDAGQSLHIAMAHAVAQKAGYIDPQKTRFDHVTFGLVLRGDGKKFKTRSGDTEKLSDLLHTAVDKARDILRERDPNLSADQLEKSAKALGINAVKYADLSCNRSQDYTFSYDRMLRFDGNTAAFLMYSYVRISGIKRRIGKQIDLQAQETSVILEDPAEISLANHLQKFNDVLRDFADSLLPHRLAEYLYQLAEKFNAFFRDCRVEGSEHENSRLILCEVTARVMEIGFSILGISTVDRM